MHDVLRTRVNDFAVKLANVNGTGSASANGLLMQAIFRMGIPVCGKNLFPSNIQGLPTWYEIRVNKEGYSARALDYDLMVAMNSQTYDRDIKEVRDNELRKSNCGSKDQYREGAGAKRDQGSHFARPNNGSLQHFDS